MLYTKKPSKPKEKAPDWRFEDYSAVSHGDERRARKRPFPLFHTTKRRERQYVNNLKVYGFASAGLAVKTLPCSSIRILLSSLAWLVF
jgi:hypothetical protein